MFLLRRTATRALSATPTKAFLARPRSITSITPAALRLRPHQWPAAAFQRRFASDEAAKTESAEAAAAEANENENEPENEPEPENEHEPENETENFAQTAAEAPVEENLTPAQQEVQAEPTDASATVGADAVEAAERAANDSSSGPSLWAASDKAPTPPGPTLYIGNLYYEVTTDQLHRVFSRFGELESVKIIHDNRGLSRGFAYVEYKNIPDAQTAVDNLDMQVFEGRNLVVQFHRSKGSNKNMRPNFDNSPSKTLFIGNMSFEMSDKDLNDLFREIRNVVDVRVAIDRRTGQPRGFAHADFIDIASAQRAKEVLDGKTVYGRQLRIDFSKSVVHDQRETRSDSTQE